MGDVNLPPDISPRQPPAHTDVVSYCARTVLPVDGPSIDHGCVVVRGDRIVAVGKTSQVADGRRVDLGETIITPGFVNAHAHLEFSALDRPLGAPGMPFADWLLEVLEYRRSPGFDPTTATTAGLRESLRYGVTTIGDIASCVPDLLFDDPPADADVTSFLELIGLSEPRAAAQLERLAALGRRQFAAANVRRGISPHAPYTVRSSLFEAAVATASALGLPLAFHLAESREELQLLEAHGGLLVDYLRKLGAWDDAAVAPGTRPLDFLRRLREAPRSLIVHGNYLSDEEIEFAAQNAERMAVVYCPRTHAYFAHEPHPLPKLLRSGAAVALGTDGRCTNPDLDLRAEMRHVATTFPELPAGRILQMGTLDGAAALGLAAECGSLTPGKRADLLVFADDLQQRDANAAIACGNAALVAAYGRGRRLAAD